MDFIYPLLVVNNNVNTRKSFILQLSLIFQIPARTDLTGKKRNRSLLKG
ncbi:DNA alkylation repair enzyme [Streptococcus mitis]|uniref:DNA alkylation repair enzyme n=1 Tax=Streptococcus mitis TaxID=28037 RepID=A0A139Q1E1_STRMT|nr:DNA alkylation repair enzyme [Streptococcus mitis]